MASGEDAGIECLVYRSNIKANSHGLYRVAVCVVIL